LKPGPNVLAVRAENSGTTPNPAGLIGMLRLTFADGSHLLIATDGRWSASPFGSN